MATVIRAKVSEKNKYWIDKHRHYELKHFCLQYPTWKKEYIETNGYGLRSSTFEVIYASSPPSDPTATMAIKRAFYLERMRMIERAARDTDEVLGDYILKGVTEGLSYSYLRDILHIPCGKDTYYNLYRRFFWLLNNLRK